MNINNENEERVFDFSVDERKAILIEDDEYFEMTKKFVDNIFLLMKQTRESFESITLEKDNSNWIVKVVYRGGHTDKINVTYDSYFAIIRDIVNRVEL